MKGRGKEASLDIDVLHPKSLDIDVLHPKSLDIDVLHPKSRYQIINSLINPTNRAVQIAPPRNALSAIGYLPPP